MVFHEHIFSATLLLIVVQVYTAISKIMKNSLQNCHPYTETFDFQISVYLYQDFCVFFPLYLSQVSEGPVYYGILAIPGIWVGEYGYPDHRECIPAHLEFISKDTEKWESLVYKCCTIFLY